MTKPSRTSSAASPAQALSCSTWAFDASSYQLGSVQDFDSDGDLDIGSAGSTITGKWFARSGAPTSAGTPVDLNTGEVQVAVFNMTVMSSTGAASVNFIPRTNSTGGNLSVSAVWFQDNDGHSYTPTSGSYGPGAPVTSFVPEPAALGLLSLGSIALCARRRPGKCSLATP